jgi:hypothetical protein
LSGSTESTSPGSWPNAVNGDPWSLEPFQFKMWAMPAIVNANHAACMVGTCPIPGFGDLSIQMVGDAHPTLWMASSGLRMGPIGVIPNSAHEDGTR